jgi:hypothetical protein
MQYERLDLWLGIVLVIIGAVAMMAFAAATFAGQKEFGQFTDAGGVAAGLEAYAGKLPGVLFAIGLIDASLIGASAISLSTAYAIGDCFSIKHSLHRSIRDAKGFYVVYAGLILIAAGIVLTPGAPLGLLTNAVQTLAGVLLPSATVFLLLLCNDKAVLGPWVNGRASNLFTGGVIALLVMLSVILTASVLFPDQTNETVIIGILIAGTLCGVIAAFASGAFKPPAVEVTTRARNRDNWRMPTLSTLPKPEVSLAAKLWMLALRLYLVLAGGLVLIRIITLAIGS